MRISQPEHAGLQMLIQKWMETDLPEAAELFKPRRGGQNRGIQVGETLLSPESVSMHAATAAYNTVISMLEAIGVE